MADAYTRNAAICVKFYALTTNTELASNLIWSSCAAKPGLKTLFVGGMFEIAASLISKGLELTVVDYSDEMVAIGRSRLPAAEVLKADLRALPFNEKFDLVVVAGRVFTHMITDSDLLSALCSCKGALRPGGVMFADNYEDSKIQSTDYFNGIIAGSNSISKIVRRSSTTLITQSPYVVRWDAAYSGEIDGQPFSFSDSIEHRAFSRNEFSDYLTRAGFKAIQQGDNFDETSFYSIAAFVS